MPTNCLSNGLIPISLSMLRTLPMQGVAFYIRPPQEASPILLLQCSERIDGARIESLLSEGFTNVYIRGEDRQRYQEALRENWRDLIENSHQPLENRMRILSEVVRDLLSGQFASGNTEGIIAACQSFGPSAVTVLGTEPVVLGQLYRVLHHDYATFTHSTNVSAYCVLLARHYGLEADDLQQIAVGGLLHDIGKLDIPESILNKPGRLDEQEFVQIKTHPTIGLEKVSHREDLSLGQIMMIYQHHERINGQGYPVGCSGDEIHLWAKICAIVDVFEALTSFRPYRQPLETDVALAVLEKGRGTEFDSELLTCWQDLIRQV